MKQYVIGIAALAAFIGLFSLALVPVGLSLATDMSVVCVAAVFLLGLLPGRTARLFFVTLCAWVVVRYLAWRYSSLPLEGNVFTNTATILLLCAELYGAAMLILGLFVNAWLLDREPAPLPEKLEDYPTVDVYIPTYSEPLSVVAPTVMAALEMDYPANKFKVYVLDDGHARALNPNTSPEQAHELKQRTEALKKLCIDHGAYWVGRKNNEHAKSGNLNSAMKLTSGELILVLDADHIPARQFLANTIGFFVDPGMAFVQTPHFFVNADPIEKNLGLFNKMPAENDMFYRVVQKGLDLWNTSFFCGSAAVIRRSAIQDAGGFSHSSITEDASTSLRMHQRGWKSAYLGIPMIGGLQPETFSAFIVQRLRWAMGMMQIMIKQNPLVVPGLSIPQRFAYLSVMLFWLFPFARIMFFLAPLFSLLLNMTVYPVGIEFFIAYTVPYLVAVLMGFQKTFGKVRRILISELHETLQTFYALPALISTLMNPNKPTFKVTPKGERLDKDFISEFNKPFYLFYALTLICLIWGVTRMILEHASRSALLLSVTWVFFNFVLLSGALGVLLERPQRRARPRIDINEKIKLIGDFGTRDAVLVNASEHTALVRTLDGEQLESFGILLDGMLLRTKPIENRYATLGRGEHAVAYDFTTPAHERAAVTLAYGEPKRWQKIWTEREASANFFVSAIGIIMAAMRGGAAHLRRLIDQSH